MTMELDFIGHKYECGQCHKTRVVKFVVIDEWNNRTKVCSSKCLNEWSKGRRWTPPKKMSKCERCENELRSGSAICPYCWNLIDKIQSSEQKTSDAYPSYPDTAKGYLKLMAERSFKFVIPAALLFIGIKYQIVLIGFLPWLAAIYVKYGKRHA